MSKKIAILPGDGIGREIVEQAVRVLDALSAVLGLAFETETALVGGAAYEAHGHPLPDSTLALARQADAILFGAVGDWKYDKLERALRPEQAILGLRKHLGLFANFRPALCYAELTHASSLKPELVAGLDILIVRELTGDIYFGQPRGRRVAVDGHFPGAEEAFDTMRYSKPEIERIAHVAFRAARQRASGGKEGARRGARAKVTSVDKANVLETFQFWKDVVTEVHTQYPEVELEHMYVDNAAMQLVRAPKKFDVVVTGNLFGDILSDEAAMLTGSIGMLPSASLDASGKGLYEPSHGSAPDIAGQGIANPLATILSAAMMLRFSLDQPAAADRVEAAVKAVLAAGLRTPDIWAEGQAGTKRVGTREMGDAVVAAVLGAAGADKSPGKTITSKTTLS
jgi:3-isopropylmalate dehydrogenase